MRERKPERFECERNTYLRIIAYLGLGENF
jgi:hypothetical protein